MAQLIVEDGAEPGRIHRLHGSVVIGRRAGCTIQLLDTAASAHHAELREGTSGYHVIDLKTSNGTYVNGKILRQPHLLRGGDRIRIGRTVFLFVAEQALEDDAQGLPIRRPTTRAPHVDRRGALTSSEGGMGAILFVLAGTAAVLWVLWKLLG